VRVVRPRTGQAFPLPAAHRLLSRLAARRRLASGRTAAALECQCTAHRHARVAAVVGHVPANAQPRESKASPLVARYAEPLCVHYDAMSSTLVRVAPENRLSPNLFPVLTSFLAALDLHRRVTLSRSARSPFTHTRACRAVLCPLLCCRRALAKGRAFLSQTSPYTFLNLAIVFSCRSSSNSLLT
jgi:hypothetical protein